jgi:hypothetical protein
LLLDLPAELKIVIYEFALIEDDVVEIDNGVQEPPLLCVCQEIRKAARKIWYADKNFRYTAVDLDLTLYHIWTEKLKALGITRQVRVGVIPSYEWENVLASCWYVWDNPTAFELHINVTGHWGKVFVGAHWIARRYRGQPWGDCLEALENHRASLAIYEPSWYVSLSHSVCLVLKSF